MYNADYDYVIGKAVEVKDGSDVTIVATVTVEDHDILGGLGSIVADAFMEAGVQARLKRIGIPDEFVSFGYPEEIYPHYGFDGPGIAKTVRAFCGRSAALRPDIYTIPVTEGGRS